MNGNWSDSSNNFSSEDSSEASPRTKRRSMQEAWKFIKRVVKRRPSLPSFSFRRTSLNISPSAGSGTFDYRPEDVEQSAFCDSIFGVMKRCQRYHIYLGESDRAELRRDWARRGTVNTIGPDRREPIRGIPIESTRTNPHPYITLPSNIDHPSPLS